MGRGRGGEGAKCGVQSRCFRTMHFVVQNDWPENKCFVQYLKQVNLLTAVCAPLWNWANVSVILLVVGSCIAYICMVCLNTLKRLNNTCSSRST